MKFFIEVFFSKFDQICSFLTSIIKNSGMYTIFYIMECT